MTILSTKPDETVATGDESRPSRRQPRSVRKDIWVLVTIGMLLIFGVFLVYPLWGVLKESAVADDGSITFEHFVRFFDKSYYFGTILNSFVVSIAVTLVSLLIGIPFSYFYTYFRLRGARFLFIGAVLSCMSAPFIGAYAWILLMGRGGLVTTILESVLPFDVGSIYGFGGIVFVLSLKLFPLVVVYMNGAFRSIDSSLLEAAAMMGSTGIKRVWQVMIRLTMPTVLAASLLVFMRAFADFGTPLLIGEGYRTFTVEIYNQYLGETGQNHNFAAAIGVIGVIVTAAVFLVQKFATSKFNFSIKSSSPVRRKCPRGLGGILMYAYMYIVVGVGLLPQLYIIYLSFRNSNSVLFLPHIPRQLRDGSVAAAVAIDVEHPVVRVRVAGDHHPALDTDLVSGRTARQHGQQLHRHAVDDPVHSPWSRDRHRAGDRVQQTTDGADGHRGDA